MNSLYTGFLIFCVHAFRTNNSDNYVVEQSSGLQVDNLSKVSGKELFRDSQYMVKYLFSFSQGAQDIRGGWGWLENMQIT